jgi:hypothetical protein
MHRHQPVELRHDLFHHMRAGRGDDGDAADGLVGGDVRHGQALDIVTARGEQAGDPGENARLVIDHHGQRVPLRFFFGDVH